MPFALEDIIDDALQLSTSYNRNVPGSVGRSIYSKLDEVISVKDFGAVGLGTGDDTPAFDAALDAIFDIAHPNGSNLSEQSLAGLTGRINGATLYIPPGIYPLKNWTIDKVVKVVGCGRASRLCPVADAISSDYVVKVVRPPNAYRNFGNHHPGVTLQDFMLDGLNRGIACGGLSLEWVDRSEYRYLTIEEFNGIGLNCQTTVRESTFSNLRMKFNGNATLPQVSLWDAETGSTDGHNNLHFIGCGFVYPLGDNIHIGRTTAASGPNRNIFISHCLFHGMTSDSAGYSNLAPTRHIYMTRGNHIHISNNRMHAWGVGVPCIYMTHEPGEDPNTGLRAGDMLLFGNNFSQAYNAATGAQVGVNSSNPHVLMDVACQLYEGLNSPEQGFVDLLVENPGSIGTVRTWLHT